MNESTESDVAYRKEAERARQAEVLLSSPIFADACNQIDAQLRVLRESVPMSDVDMHTRLILTEQMFGKLLDYLRATMASGDYARQQLQLRDGLAERTVAAIRRGIRF